MSVIPALRESEEGRLQGQEFETSLANMKTWRGAVAHAVTALREAKAGGSQGQEIETILANMLLRRLRQENCLNLGGGDCSEPKLHAIALQPGRQEQISVSKKKKRPATWEAEAGESLEPGRQRLQSAEITPLHSSPGDSVKLHLKKKKKTKPTIEQSTKMKREDGTFLWELREREEEPTVPDVASPQSNTTSEGPKSPGRNLLVTDLCHMQLTKRRKGIKERELRPGAMAHACNPTILGGQGGQITCCQQFETSLANMILATLYT
ncbi:hypothetical protein AAY473_004208 [Plecturocebus cupreus]